AEGQVPAVLAVLAAEAVLGLKRLPLLARFLHQAPSALTVVGVNRLHPPASNGLFHRNAYILDPLLIAVINQPVRAASVDDLGHGVGEFAEARLAVTYRLIGQNAICNVQNRADYAQRRALRVIEDMAPGFDPSQFAGVSAQYPKLHRPFFEPMFERSLKVRLTIGDVTRVNVSAPIFVCAD